MDSAVSNKKTGLLIQVFVIMALGIAIYSNTFRAGFQFDDMQQLAENFRLRQLSTIGSLFAQLNTRFLTYITFALNYQFSRTDVFGYHLVNLFIHLATSLLVMALARLTFQTPQLERHPLSRHAPALAFFSGLIFLAHPVQTQAVVYIVQRLAVLATLAYVGVLVLYVRARLKPTVLRYAAVYAAAFAAMFTKEITVTLPAAVILFEAVFFSGFGKKLFQSWRGWAPLLLMWLVMPVLFLRSAGGPAGGLAVLNRGGETAAIVQPDYLLTQLNVVRTYVRLLVLPVYQNLDYDYPIAHTLLEGRTFLSLIFLSVIFAAAVGAYKKQKLIAFGIFWFFLTLSAESSVIPIRDVIFEHRLYLPMAGFAMLLPSAVCLLFKDERKSYWILGALVVVLSVAAYRRNELWKDPVTLWQDTVKKSPQKARAYRNLAFHYNEEKKYDRAIEVCREALRLDPKSAGCYVTMGVASDAKGQIDQAIAFYNEALRLNPPDRIKVFTNLGAAYGKKGDFENAIKYFREGIRINPDYPPLHNNLGFAYDQTGNGDKAIEEYRQAIRIDPDFAEAYNHLGIAYGKKGIPDKTIEYCQQAVRLKPDFADAYNNIGVAYGLKGRPDTMIEFCRKAIAVDPGYARAYFNLIQGLTATGRLNEAKVYEEQARRFARGT
ncbi:MAG: tetratricopeptide repeat protein [Candidatus Omnitrophica bacterium]|nr:tetratricopeptide repeat protein [Candidatus Omnitrophota bacterium]MDD5670394.1 tetratricopeptide repeat protein [Candidatus Omnitrophota bacterium]